MTNRLIITLAALALAAALLFSGVSADDIEQVFGLLFTEVEITQ